MKKLLVIDDSEMFTSLIEMLFGEDFEVIKAADGFEGMERANDLQPDLILLDVMMPRMSGIEVLRRLQVSERTTAIPVAIITAQKVDAGMERSLQREPNVSFFLLKNCGSNAIVDAVYQILGDPKATPDGSTEGNPEVNPESGSENPPTVES